MFGVRCWMFLQQFWQAGGEPWDVGLFSKGAFPDGDDVPAEIAEGVFVAEVAGLIAVDLGLPEGTA